MCSKTFLVEHCEIDNTKSGIIRENMQIETSASLHCFGERYRLIIYFVTPTSRKPLGYYLPSQETAITFVSDAELKTYEMMIGEKDPIYAYFNEDFPELNCISVNEPMRDFSFKIPNKMVV